MNYHYGYLIRILHHCTNQAVTSELESMDLTAAQGHVMAYIAHQEKPPCPRDIESEFQLSHPTVSGLLSRLEQKGFLELRTDPDDRRCKRIFMLERGRQCHARMHCSMRETEERICSGFTPEQQEEFSQLLQKAIINMGGDVCRPKSKEETET